MLTQTNVINSIELGLGYRFTDLEITHDEIMEIIKLVTIPEFSKWFPHQERVVIDRRKI